MKPFTLLSAFIFLFIHSISAQQISYLDSSQKGVSFRGLSVVNDSILWVSGSKGTVGKSSDGGQHFAWMKPRGFENRDFRDVEAFDEKTAIIMAIDSPGIILKTTNGGTDWKVVYENHLHGIFLDAMCFKNNLRGICLGDPIDQKFWLVETNDGGDTWNEIPAAQRPTAMQGEACFASSGTNLQFVDDIDFEYGFITGGKNARLFIMNKTMAKPGTTIDLDINKGLETTGANSLAVKGKNYMAVGGDFKDFHSKIRNSLYSNDAGKHWKAPLNLPTGYKSCVIWLNDKTLVSTGTSGTDIALNGPSAWKNISDLSFHVVQKARDGTAVFLAGGNGKIAKIIF